MPARSSTHDHTGEYARPPMRIEKWDNLIVNSISIHELPGDDAVGSSPEIVAIVTNNNNTVRMYSLSHEELLLKLEFEFAMNHASISPDGKYFIIVGDQNRAYIGKSILEGNRDVSKTRSSLPKPIRSTWVHLREIELHKHPMASRTGYFTTAWSADSSQCATASENGFVTLLDVSCFEDLDADPVLTVMPSSNPSSSSSDGSIRSMSFLPSIYNQLLWVEENGRACLADVRDGLLTRQLIDLDSEAKDVNHVQVEDFTDLPELEAVDRASDLDVMNSRQRTARWSTGETPASTDTMMEGLTDQERHIIDGIRLTRSREERIAAQRRLRAHTSNAPPTPMSIRYNQSSESVRPSFAQSVLRVIQAEAGQSRTRRIVRAVPPRTADETPHDTLAELGDQFTSLGSHGDRQMDWQSFLDAYDTLHEVARPPVDNRDPDDERDLPETVEALGPTPPIQRQIADRAARVRRIREQMHVEGSTPTSRIPVTVDPPVWARARTGITSYTLSSRWDNNDPKGTTGHVVSPDGKTM